MAIHVHVTKVYQGQTVMCLLVSILTIHVTYTHTCDQGISGENCDVLANEYVILHEDSCSNSLKEWYTAKNIVPLL